VAGFSVHEIACKSAINRVTGMPFAWSLNPYRGCRHACVYCYARPTHEFLGLNGAQDFEEIIFAKVNAPQIVRQELARRSWQGESVAIGTATDPYQQAETRYRLTRGILEAFRDFRNPLTITTKSPLVLRDLDLLADLARSAQVSVQLTVTTMDERLWRILEPTTPKPWKRIEALRILRERGIRAGIFLSPLLPGLTDDSAHIEAVIAAAAGAGADFVWGGTLRLADGVREFYLDVLQREFPNLVAGYERIYRGAYVATEYRDRVHARLDALRQRYGLGEDRPAPQPAQPAPKQLSLFSAVA